MDESKKSSWNLFLDELDEATDLEGRLEEYKRAVTEDNIRLILPDISWVLTELPSKDRDRLLISFHNFVAMEYTPVPYSLEKSKEIIITSIEELAKKYDVRGIPLVYTTLPLPSYVNYPSHVWRELSGTRAFSNEDYGHLNFLRALVALQKEEVISTSFFDILYADNKTIVFKVVVHYKGVGVVQHTDAVSAENQTTYNLKKQVEMKSYLSLQAEKGIGYLKFYKQGPKIRIGNIKTRKFRLLEILFDPLGVAKTVYVVFEAIKLPRDESDGRLGNDYLSEERRRELIEYTMKELQKIKELKGKIRLDFVNNKKSVRLLLSA